MQAENELCLLLCSAGFSGKVFPGVGCLRCHWSQFPSRPEGSLVSPLPQFHRTRRDGGSEKSRKGRKENTVFQKSQPAGEERMTLTLPSFSVWGPTSCVFTAASSAAFSQVLVAPYLEPLEGSPFLSSNLHPGGGMNFLDSISDHLFPG